MIPLNLLLPTPVTRVRISPNTSPRPSWVRGIRLVPDLLRAWHAERSRWRGIEGVNTISLGWEIANRNDGIDPYTDAQYATLARLAAFYVRQGIGLGDFVSHAGVALPPGRKSDPRGWDWPRFFAQTRSLLPPPT